MSVSITVSNEVAEHLRNLSVPAINTIDDKLRRLLVAEYRRKLAHYRLTDQQLRQKYSMSFVQFEERQMTRELDFSWEVESDAIAWETAVDGIQTAQRQLNEIAGGEADSDS